MALILIKVHAVERLGYPVKSWLTPFVLFAVFSPAYVFLAPNLFQQDWDSLMYAYWAEVEGIRSIWGNHPLGHVILNSIYVILSSLDSPRRALPVFITWNGLIGGSSVTLFFVLMKTIGIDYWFSLGYAVIFGASYSIWRLSGTADIYSISFLLLISAWLSLSYELQVRKARYLFFSGALAGLSVLSHQLNGVFFLAAIVMIVLHKNDRWPRIVTFYLAACLLILSGSLLFGYIATSSLSLAEIYHWFRGYLGDAIYGELLTLESVSVSSRVALQTVLAPTLGRARFIRTALYGFLLILILLGVTQVRRLDGEKKIILLSAFLQCLVSFFLITWFEPWYPKFWSLVLVPGMITIVCCLAALEQGLASRLSNFWDYKKYYSPLLLLPGIIVLVFNLRYAILNEHAPDVVSQEAMNTWLEQSDQNDMLITAGDLIPQLWFWSDRPNTVHLYHYLVVNEESDDRFEYLRDQINQFLCQGNSVLYTPAVVDHFGASFLKWLAISREEINVFFDGYQKESYFTYVNRINGRETQVFKLINPDACSE